MKLTELEIEMIKELANEYEKYYEEDVEWHNLGWDMDKTKAKQRRGTLASLTKKEILEYSGLLPENRNCFNPIYRGKNWKEALNEIGIEDKSKIYIPTNTNEILYKELHIVVDEEMTNDINYARDILKDIERGVYQNCYSDKEEMANDLRGIIESIVSKVLGE